MWISRKQLFRLVFLLFLLFAQIEFLSGSFFGLDKMIGYGLDGVLKIVSFGAPALKEVEDPQTLSQLNEDIDKIHGESGAVFRYPHVKVKLIKGSSMSPNAASTGPTIYVSYRLTQILNNLELTAVLAHELAHAELGHLVQRLPFPIGILCLHGSRWVRGKWEGIMGHDDPFMDELKVKGHWQMMQDISDGAELAQEIQADTLAARWLEGMSKRGQPNRPEDLNAASSRMLGLDLARLPLTSTAVSMRAHAITNKLYLKSFLQ